MALSMPPLAIEAASLARRQPDTIVCCTRPSLLAGHSDIDFIELNSTRKSNEAEEVLGDLVTSKACHTHTSDCHRQSGLSRKEGYSPKRLNEQILSELAPDIDVATYASLLRCCTKARALPEGEHVHQHMIKRGYAGERFLSNLLIQMYSKCGSLQHAREVFDVLAYRNSYTWTIMISACTQNGRSKEALRLFSQMQTEGFEPNQVTFISILGACASVAALEEGREMHATLVANGWESDVILGTVLVNFYGKCRSLHDVRAVFAEMPLKNVICWNAMITACDQIGQDKEALQLFGQMHTEGFEPHKITFICILEVCASLTVLEEGREMHALVAGSGWESDVVVATSLVNMYGKCGSLDDASAVFAEMPLRDVVSWNAMMAAYTRNGHSKEALTLFGEMQAECLKLTEVTFSCALDVCASMAALEEGQEIYAAVTGNGWESDVVVGNTLINMYVKCGSLNDASAVFAEMPQRDVVSWNALMTGCAQNGHLKKALELFDQMNAEGFKPGKITFICVLDACASVAALEKGEEMHAIIACYGYELNVVVGNSLVNMYGKCGSLDDARAVFTEMPVRDVVSWSAMVAACAQNGHNMEALQLFGRMQVEGCEPNKITLICIMDACACVAALEDSLELHVTIAGSGWESDIVVGNTLVNMYGKCGSLNDARAVFAEMPLLDVVSWNAIMAGCAQNGHSKETLQLFGQMQAEGFEPNQISIICALDACASVTALEGGRGMHARVAGNGWESDLVVGNALINMYGKCGSLYDAGVVFSEMPLQDVASWSVMMATCAQNGYSKEALKLFGQMQTEGLVPNEVTFICILDACASGAALEEAREVHAVVAGKGWDLDLVVGNTLVNMYGKCGSVDDSRTVFIEMPLQDAVSWNAMMAAYAQNGYGKEVLQLFGKMQAEGFKPDKVTFISILTACSHTGLVEYARQYFISMAREHGITPSLEHYMCMVDILGRGGLLEEAENLILSMPFEHAALAWLSLLSSCRIHSDVERAECAASLVFELAPRNASPYVLLSNMHSNLGRSRH